MRGALRNRGISHSPESIVFEIAVFEDAPADPLAVAIARETVFDPGASELHGTADENTLAEDFVLLAGFVGQARVCAERTPSAVGRPHVQRQVRQRAQLGSVPQAPDMDFGQIRTKRNAHRIEPEAPINLAAEIVPAIKLLPIALAAPAVVAMAETINRSRPPAERDRPG